MHSAVAASKAYIEARIRQQVDKRGAAAAACVSDAYLRELFAREVGMPPSRYIMSRRIANAAFDILYTDRALLDIALDYGFAAYDTFTRAFRRVTGCTPNEFRTLRPSMARRALGGGLFGIALTTHKEADMNHPIQQDEQSVLLYDVPRVRFGAYGGVTPYPICLKALANYMGEDIDYADAITGCGAAFRLTWNTESWDGSNVDVCHTYTEKEPLKVYLQGVTAIGRSCRALERHDDGDRESIKAFITETLRKGVPVIAMGIVGPPEAGLVTGFRDGGETLLGWSVFQEYMQEIKTDPCGYYVTSAWWENGVDTLIAMGDKVCPVIGAMSVAKRALEVLTPRADGAYRKGLAAYDAWKRDIDNDANFPAPQSEDALQTLGQWQMCQNDAADCLADGRFNAQKYFKKHEKEHPLFSDIADAFGEVSACAQSMFKALGGFARDERQMRALAERARRDDIIRLIDQAASADARAYQMLGKVCGDNK